MVGRKRHILVDTLGLVIAVVVHPADVQDRDGALLVLEEARQRDPARIAKVLTDGAYNGARLQEWVGEHTDWVLEMVLRPKEKRGFSVIRWRWIVERTFAWLGLCRQLSREYDRLESRTEGWIRLAMIGLMLRRLTGEENQQHRRQDRPEHELLRA